MMKKSILVLMVMIFAASLMAPWQSVQAQGMFSTRSGEMAARSAEIDPAVQAALDALQPGDMLGVVVMLRQQANLSQVIASDRAERSRGVVLALQAMANATQGKLKQLLETRLNEGSVQSYESLWVFNGLSVTATRAVIEEVAQQQEVLQILPDEIEVVPTGSLSAPAANLTAIQAPALWDLGFTGQGVVVANLDSGVDVSHPDLVTRWRGGSNSWFDPYGQHPTTPVDYSGHGTWTMGIMVGGGASGVNVGVAPDAQWIAARVFDDRGRSKSSAIHQAFQWVLDPDGNPDTGDTPQVVNNSWSLAYSGCDLTFEPDLLALRAAGILPVFAAGNGGPGSNTSYSPANNPSAFAVGAIDNTGVIWPMSSRGPSACANAGAVFPDITAPGVNILTTGLYGTYYQDSGTSLSAPHVAGGLALLLSAFPNESADDQENAVLSSAVDLGASGPDNVYGYGALNLLAAYDWLATTPPSPTPTPEPTLPPVTSMHVGDLDGASSPSGSKWSASATIVVHGNDEQGLANATVSGKWSSGASGSGSCVTDANGRCVITKSGIPGSKTSVVFTVTNVTAGSLTYQSSANHDPEGDSNGTVLTINK